MRRINQCLNSQLANICQHAIRLDGLNSVLHTYLPPSLRAHCQVGEFNKGTLYLRLLDPVWASQLRYIIPELRDRLRNEAGLYQLIAIKVRAVMADESSAVKQKEIQRISPAARDVILQNAQQCSYLPLKQALCQLATDATS